MSTPATHKGKTVRPVQPESPASLETSPVLAAPAQPTNGTIPASERFPSYVLKDGTFSTEPYAETIGCRFEVPGLDQPYILNFADLPDNVKHGLMCFGLKTAGINAVNTGKKEGKSQQRFLARAAAWKGGFWMTRTGGGDKTPSLMPVIIEAISTLMTRKGLKTPKDINSNPYATWQDWADNKWRVDWPTLDSKARATFTKTWAEKPGMEEVILEIRSARAKAKASTSEVKEISNEDFNDL